MPSRSKLHPPVTHNVTFLQPTNGRASWEWLRTGDVGVRSRRSQPDVSRLWIAKRPDVCKTRACLAKPGLRRFVSRIGRAARRRYRVVSQYRQTEEPTSHRTPAASHRPGQRAKLWPVFGSTRCSASPKLLTSNSPLALPKPCGANGDPTAIQRPREINRSMKLPLVSNTLTKPWPGPGTSSFFSASCFA